METAMAGPNTPGTLDPAEADQAIERELDLVNGAIELVASGVSRRVTVVGLRFGEQLLSRLEPRARASHVTVRSLWSPSDPYSNIAVEAR